MRAIIHIGMNKTGSSAIQAHFAGLRHPNLTYAPWMSSNHSGLFVLLFCGEETRRQYPLFKAGGEDLQRKLRGDISTWERRFKRAMRDCVSGTFLITGEDISNPALRHGVEPLQSMLREHFDEVRVLAYVRGPRSFATSAFQQRLKGGGLRDLRVERLWPHYRKRIADFDRVFGKENVEIREFHQSHLKDGDIVADFAEALGVPAGQSRPEAQNESLSAEATAMLYCQRKFGDGLVAGYPGALLANKRFVRALASVGDGRLAFSQGLWDPVLDENSDDLAWMEDRLGRPFLEGKQDPRDRIIDGEEDLVALACQAWPALAAQVPGAKDVSPPGGPRTIAAQLDALRRSLV